MIPGCPEPQRLQVPDAGYALSPEQFLGHEPLHPPGFVLLRKIPEILHLRHAVRLKASAAEKLTKWNLVDFRCNGASLPASHWYDGITNQFFGSRDSPML